MNRFLIVICYIFIQKLLFKNVLFHPIEIQYSHVYISPKLIKSNFSSELY